MISTQEFKYICIATIFAFLIFIIAIPFLLSLGIENSSPYLQFFIFNIGLFVFFQVFLRSMTLSKKINIRECIGLIFLFSVFDLWMPPMMVNTSGQLLQGVALYGSAIDYIVGNFLINSFQISGFLVYSLVYVAIPFILLLASSILLKNFVKNL